jgi:uracil-DNA glycosylase
MYYPGKNPKGGDLKPSLDIANKWLREEISYLNPELFLIIGGLSAKFFFPHKSLSELAMNDQEVNNTQALVLPHPSPINIAWFKKHPEFESSRVPEISKIVKKSLHKQ